MGEQQYFKVVALVVVATGRGCCKLSLGRQNILYLPCTVEQHAKPDSGALGIITKTVAKYLALPKAQFSFLSHNTNNNASILIN